MSTLTDAVNALVTNTTGLQTTVTGRITDMDGKLVQADTAKVAAEAAKALAEIAKSGADTAKTDAETAQTLAESAKAAAETAQGIAATAKTDALLAKSASETAKDNAVAAQTASESAKTNAQDWASKTSGAVAGGEMSAKYHAQTASTDAGTATTKAAAASTSEGNALASKNTATTKATAAGTSESNASSSASAASSSATAASGSASTATTKASDAASSATASASSASAASGSASTATTKASDANTSANAAASSASTAASTLSDRYTKAETDAKIVQLAPKEVLTAASNPAVAAEGVLFYNTTADVLNVSDGSAWKPVYEPPGTADNPFSSLSAVTSEGYTYVTYKGSTVYGYVKDGWILAMRARNDGVWGWTSAYWENSSNLNETTNPKTSTNIKNGSVWTAPGVISIRVSGNTASTSIMDNNLDFTFNTSESLQQMFQGALNRFSGNVSAGRTAWLNWYATTTGHSTGNFNSQPYCNTEAINCSYSSNGARIGITMNNENDCNSNDSGIGLGVRRSSNPGAGGEDWSGGVGAAYGHGALWVK